ncbi:MAG: hypothetical protein H8D67_01040, partial [Deltaproteobacteria bacterium]|nr:hypothetical protein [Deltaproteobacteria bacterium]
MQNVRATKEDKMKDKIWDVEHKGHNIRAINRVSFFPPQTSEILEIDGTVIEHVKGSFLRRNSAIVTKHSF